jgi:hypothetical protein
MDVCDSVTEPFTPRQKPARPTATLASVPAASSRVFLLGRTGISMNTLKRAELGGRDGGCVRFSVRRDLFYGSSAVHVGSSTLIRPQQRWMRAISGSAEWKPNERWLQSAKPMSARGLGSTRASSAHRPSGPGMAFA